MSQIPRLSFVAKVREVISEDSSNRIVKKKTRIGKKLHPAEAIVSKSQSLGSKVARRILLLKRLQRESGHRKGKENKIGLQTLGEIDP